MPVFTLGLSHKTAPLDVRERVVFSAEDSAGALAHLARLDGIEEAAIISTCNRTEIYTFTHSDNAADMLGRWLAEQHRLEYEWLRPYLYSYRGRDAVNQLLTVASGLDSLVLGEPQILGQTKVAYHQSAAAGTLGQALERLFQHAFSVAKQVRSETSIGENPVSVAYAAVSLAKQIFGDIPRRAALLVGAGEMIELTARHLKDQGLQKLIVANRSEDKAEKIAESYDGEGISLSDIPHRLAEADIIVTSTASALPILGKGSVESALRTRKHRPFFMVDLAVPRDIEPEVAELRDVYLYSIDDLRSVIEENVRSRETAASQASEIVDTQVERFMTWLRTLDAVDAIRELRDNGDRLREQTLRRARQRLARGESPEAALEYLANTLTKKLLHEPTVGLRQAAGSGDMERLRVARELLGLPREDDSES
ncbi:glutamyl-tRNA reductase [Ectothiorhodospiraceae bacterium WFHF3C12]|nr:glutamyl-tRNA reductase [Ectothiorhodospiraceae bacterium WFHF3C12]